MEDEDSQAVTIQGEGISAFGRAAIGLDARNGRKAQALKRNLRNHLDWGSRCTSSLISTYDDKDIAFEMAYRRRHNCGKLHVTITVIDAWKVKKK